MTARGSDDSTPATAGGGAGGDDHRPGPPRRAGRGARRGTHRRVRDELPRLPDQPGRRAVAQLLGPLLPSLAGAAVDPLRRHVRAHRRRRRHAAHPPCHGQPPHQPGGRRRQAVDAGSAGPRAVRVRIDLLRDLVRFDPALLRGDVRHRRLPVHAGDAVAGRHRCLGGGRRSGHPLVGLREGARRAVDKMAHQPADQLAAWAAVQRIRQRHAPVAPVARLPLRRDDPRPPAAQ